MVAWHDNSQDGSNTGVFARRLATLPTLDIDADGSTEPLTDGLLVLRRLFGFSGATLVAGAVDLVDCARCDSTAIVTYLTSVVTQLDIDGDGETEPLTDGLLVLRWLFGFTGSTLVTGAVGGGCVRCDAARSSPISRLWSRLDEALQIGGYRRRVAARAAAPTAPVIRVAPLNPKPKRRMSRASVSGSNTPLPSTSNRGCTS